jgi:hypothetical protein
MKRPVKNAIAHTAGMLFSFLLAETSFLCVALAINSFRQNSGEVIAEIGLIAVNDLPVAFVILHLLWVATLTLARRPIRDHFSKYWLVGIPIGVFLAAICVYTPLWPT